MEKYEKIRNELKNLNLIDIDGISEEILNRLIDKKIKKKENEKIILSLSLISIGIIILSIFFKKIHKN